MVTHQPWVKFSNEYIRNHLINMESTFENLLKVNQGRTFKGEFSDGEKKADSPLRFHNSLR